MHRHDPPRGQQFHRLKRVVGAHRVIVPDRQGRQRQPASADQPHVGKQAGVAGEIDVSLGQRDDETSRIAAVGAVGQHRRVVRDRHFHAPKREVKAAAQVHRVRLLQPLGAEPLADLKVGDDRRAGAPRDLLHVGHVIEMTVGNKNPIGVDLAGFHRRNRRIVEKRVKQDRLPARLDRPTAVSQPGEFGCHRLGSPC